MKRWNGVERINANYLEITGYRKKFTSECKNVKLSRMNERIIASVNLLLLLLLLYITEGEGSKS